jgi:S1-C subfamily serine protease
MTSGGCLTVPVTYAPTEADAEAKTFKAPTGAGRVYVFRDEHFGSMYPLRLTLDQQPVGDFAAMTYAVFDLLPGAYEFSSTTPEATSQVLVDADGGTIKYLWLEMKMGWMYPRVLLQEVDEKRGQQGVMRSKLIVFPRFARAQRGGQGTAWRIGDRHLVTNQHVVGTRTKVTVVSSRGVEYEMSVVAADPVNDLAVLMSDRPIEEGPPIPLAVEPAKVGERVISIGFPLAILMGNAPKLTTGDISAKSGVLDDPRLYQFSAPTQPGNSGGPLLNSAGQAVGVVSSKLSTELTVRVARTVPEGVGYAVKIAYLRPLLDGITLPPAPEAEAQSPDAIFEAYGNSVFQVKP